ncbi:hypothetical protein pb186bvf_005416 [Paramecium bursaria]
MIMLVLLLLQFASADSDKDRIFSYNVVILEDYDFFQSTQFEKRQEKPWLILFYHPYEKSSMDFIPIYEELAIKGQKKDLYIAALDCYKHEDTRDRIVVSTFPHIIYFDMQGQMHRYKGDFSLQDLTEFLLEDGWQQIQAKSIPKQINYWKRFWRKAVSIFVIIPVILILCIAFWIWMCMQQKKKDLVKQIDRMNEAQNIIEGKKKQYLKQE